MKSPFYMLMSSDGWYTFSAAVLFFLFLLLMLIIYTFDRYQEYIDYLFPEETQTTNLKILEAAYKWNARKKQKKVASDDEDEDDD